MTDRVIYANDVPDQGVACEPPAHPRMALRTKGKALFGALTLYVTVASTLLIDYALQLPDPGNELQSLIGVAVVVALLGLATFGAFLVLFFGRLAQDLGRIQERAIEIVRGFRGKSLQISRNDELGVLAQSINYLSVTLADRERDVMLARLDRLHQERMTLLAAVAAGLAHEIGNPLAAISASIEECATSGNTASMDLVQLQSQVRRLSSITRRMAMATQSMSRETGPLSLNAVVESAAVLVSFDWRFQRIIVTPDLDPMLPLVQAAEDDVMQLLIYLLTNAMEALEGKEQGSILLSTRCRSDGVELVVADNGCGMDEATLNRAFEPFFTTRKGGRGSGLGLDACQAIMVRSGGSIELTSRHGIGTRVTCLFRSLL